MQQHDLVVGRLLPHGYGRGWPDETAGYGCDVQPRRMAHIMPLQDVEQRHEGRASGIVDGEIKYWQGKEKGWDMGMLTMAVAVLQKSAVRALHASGVVLQRRCS